jgi:ABC-type multidrug transport system fused ATPase/permease subunit
VGVLAGGHWILEGVDLDIRPGEHVAVVGPSGAGKSSLVGLLLGWHRPSSGTLEMDGARPTELRRDTAWVDPDVMLWNRSLLDNLRYGSTRDGLPMASLVEEAGLLSVLERLPGGMQMPLGEGGALISGGEGQRVRLGRAMQRTAARLVILDEPFRGLDRDHRRELYTRARKLWSQATLLCITHDMAETRAFPRVLVVEGGRVVEDGRPEELAREGTRYRALLDAEEAVRVGLWANPSWRRQVLRRNGLSNEEADRANEAPTRINGRARGGTESAP